MNQKLYSSRKKTVWGNFLQLRYHPFDSYHFFNLSLSCRCFICEILKFSSMWHWISILSLNAVGAKGQSEVYIPLPSDTHSVEILETTTKIRTKNDSSEKPQYFRFVSWIPTTKSYDWSTVLSITSSLTFFLLLLIDVSFPLLVIDRKKIW